MKKFYLFLLVAFGVWWYATHRFNFADTMVYAKNHPKAWWAPAAEYYVGLVYYQRDDFQQSEDAFNQLLTDFPGSAYEGRGLLRLSEAAEGNRDFQTAKDSVAKYIEEYPDGADRGLAERRKEYLLNK